MPLSDADRRLLVLCGLIPLPELTQEEVDYLFRQLVEDVPTHGEADLAESDG